MEKVGITIIGAGIIGLAVAKELSAPGKTVFVIEKNRSFGMEASSRNSEVIHSGIYYPQGSLKHFLCLEGNRLLYEICEKQGVNFRKTGKLIVAAGEDELEDLYILYENGKTNNVPGIKLISSSEITALETCVKGIEAIFVPTTGILDSHALMEYFIKEAGDKGAEFAYNAEVTGIEKKQGCYRIRVADADSGTFEFDSEVVVNCAGLDSDRIAEMAKTGQYKIKYCKGTYFRLKNPSIGRLIYPVVKKGSVSLGIHVTPDLAGGIRLGPDVEYITSREKDYTVNESKMQMFYEQTKKLIPELEINDIYPDTAGIRAKLQGPGEDFRDFVIKEESEQGFEGFVNLIGIESPGLTASVAIAKMVKNVL
jgi:L-2-hydroxyglutarate oxidase LhgO